MAIMDFYHYETLQIYKTLVNSRDASNSIFKYTYKVFNIH